MPQPNTSQRASKSSKQDVSTFTVNKDMVEPIVKNLLIESTILKKAINETGIIVRQNQNSFTHMNNEKEIDEENLASC